jgi:hypothetical protein
MAGWKRAFLALMLLLAGCVALDPPKGQSGPIEWEVYDIVQTWEERGTRLRWDYVVALTNSGSRGIYLQEMQIGSQGRELHGGIGVEQVGRRLEPGETMRLTLWDALECSQCAPAHIAPMMSEGMTKFMTILGSVDGGDPARVEIRLRLNSGVGRAAEKTR